MRRNARIEPVVGQEMIQFDGPRTISFMEYDQKEAKNTAKLRKKRIGELVTELQIEKDITKGFLKESGGLWVPHSGTENSAVVRGPVPFMRDGSNFIRDKVFEKYRNDDDEYDVSIARLAVWAQFAAEGQRRRLATQFNTWRINARDKRSAMHEGFYSNGKIDRALIEKSSRAIGGVSLYLSDVKSFVGHPDRLNERGRRVWHQDKWVKKQAEHHKWTSNFLNQLPDYELEAVFDEAYYNHFSRAKYWHDVIERDKQISQDIAAQEKIEEFRRYLEGED